MSAARPAHRQIQAGCGRGLNAAIAQRQASQGQPSASRITGDDGRFQVEPVVEQAGATQPSLRGHWIVGVRCAGVIGDQRRHSGAAAAGRPGRDGGRAQGVGTAVQVDQRPAGCMGVAPMDRDTGVLTR